MYMYNHTKVNFPLKQLTLTINECLHHYFHFPVLDLMYSVILALPKQLNKYYFTGGTSVHSDHFFRRHASNSK